MALAEQQGVQISNLSLKDLQGLDSNFGEDVKSVFDFETSVEKRASIGGTSKAMVGRQVDVLRKSLAAARQE